jgi:hypothetical protein
MGGKGGCFGGLAEEARVAVYISSHIHSLALSRSTTTLAVDRGQQGRAGRARRKQQQQERHARARERDTTRPKEGAQDARYRKKKASSKGNGHLFRFLTRITLASGSKKMESLEEART